MSPAPSILEELPARFGPAVTAEPARGDAVPTFRAAPADAWRVLQYLKTGAEKPYRMLYDLWGLDERPRVHRPSAAPADFTVVYHLLSFDRNEDVRVKVPLLGEQPSLRTITDLWPSASWYEREAWDMLGIGFDGHPNLRRLLMPAAWQGHPLRKEHPARATEMEPFRLTAERQTVDEDHLQFRPEEWGLARQSEDTEFMFLNLGPHHTGTHGVLRIVLQLDGEQIVDAVPDIGFHHRGAEKMGERQTWHTYIPYTDRVDYLAGVLNNLPYLLAVEALAGITPPPRAQVIRVMLCELFRIASHLVWYGTYAQDLGGLSPVFYTFADRERLFGIVEAVCGGRMHPGWFRIGGVAQDLPDGWDRLVRDFLDYLPPRLKEYDHLILRNPVFRARSVNVGRYTLQQAIDWGVTGPGLRACGFAWDFRRKRPYSGYENFEFDIPTAEGGDAYARSVVRVEEMRQSLRIVRQCLEHMPAGPYLADHPLTTPPPRERMNHDIETLIHHFLGVSWGPVIPPGEAFRAIESSKGNNGYHLVSDGGTGAYRLRIRTPSFPHMQMLPLIARGLTVSDLISILGAMDYVLADVDR